jgi:hypothetical protein
VIVLVLQKPPVPISTEDRYSLSNRNLTTVHHVYATKVLYPDIVWVEYFSDSQDIAKGHRKVTYREFANAVHALAWWIEENVGKPTVGDGRETMVYIGPNDLRYGILVLASIVTGYTVSRDDVEL